MRKYKSAAINAASEWFDQVDALGVTPPAGSPGHFRHGFERGYIMAIADVAKRLASQKPSLWDAAEVVMDFIKEECGE